MSCRLVREFNSRIHRLSRFILVQDGVKSSIGSSRDPLSTLSSVTKVNFNEFFPPFLLKSSPRINVPRRDDKRGEKKKRKGNGKKTRNNTRGKERENRDNSQHDTAVHREARRRVSSGNSIVSRLMNVNFCTFPLAIRGHDNVSSVFPFPWPPLLLRERNGTVYGEEARPIFSSSAWIDPPPCAGTEKKVVSFSGKRSLPIETASTTIDFRLRIHMARPALC